jgi:hypothetical protein
MNFQSTRQALLAMMAAAAFGAGLTACGGSTGAAPPPSTPSAPSGSATPVADSASPATAPTLSVAQLQFVSDMRSAFGLGNDVPAAKLASFGQHVCNGRQAGTSVAGEVPYARRSWASISKGDAVQMVTLAEKDLCPAESAPEKVTYVVTGSAANVTYGPTGSDYTGTAPMSVTRPLGQPQFYSINAQVTGNGTVTCKLQVDGVTIATGSASGDSSVASCEIQQGLNGSWEETSAGG